jgi:hypothetical protein
MKLGNPGPTEPSEIWPKQKILTETLKMPQNFAKKIFWQKVAKIWGKKPVGGSGTVSNMLVESFFGKANIELQENQKKNMIA